MNRIKANIHLLALILLLFFAGCQEKVDTQQETEAVKISPLEAYVNTKDDAFEYELVDKIKEEGYTFYVIRMVSQSWLTTQEVKDPIWKSVV